MTKRTHEEAETTDKNDWGSLAGGGLYKNVGTQRTIKPLLSKVHATATTEKIDPLCSFRNMFYNKDYAPYSSGTFTRQKCTDGIGHSCYIGFRFILLRWVLCDMAAPEHIDNTHILLYEQFLFSLISFSPNFANIRFTGQLQQQNKKLITYLHMLEEETKNKTGSSVIDDPVLLTESIKHIYKANNGLFDEEGIVDNLLTYELQQISNLFLESEKYPIPLALGMNHDIDHWFILYQNKFLGVAGLDNVNIPYIEIPITPEKFYKFLSSIKNKNITYFSDFMKEAFLPQDRAIINNPSVREGEERNEYIKGSIDGIIERSFHKINNDKYTVYKINGYKKKPYVDTLKDIINNIKNLDAVHDGNNRTSILGYRQPSEGGAKRKPKRKSKRKKRTRRTRRRKRTKTRRRRKK